MSDDIGSRESTQELDIDGANNVIIRNLSISRVAANDGGAIYVTDSASHVWIDHNDRSSARISTAACWTSPRPAT